MTEFAFHEVVIGINVGDVEEGTEFKTSSGFHALYKNGVLRWVTNGGYVGSPVTVSKENIAEVFTVLEPEAYEKISFTDAMQYLAEGDTVSLLLEGREYDVSNFTELDDLISNHEFFADVYKATFTVPVEKKAVELPFSEDEKEPEPVPDVHSKKLTHVEAYSILHAYYISKVPVIQLAFDYEVSTRMIYYILDGTNWGNVHKQFKRDLSIMQEMRG